MAAQQDYRRGDGWSARPADDEARTWAYFRPDGERAGSVEGAGPDQVFAILTKVAEAIDEAP